MKIPEIKSCPLLRAIFFTEFVDFREAREITAQLHLGKRGPAPFARGRDGFVITQTCGKRIQGNGEIT